VRIFDRLRDEGEELVLILWALSREVRTWKQLVSLSQQTSWQNATTSLGIWRDRAEVLGRVCRQLSSAVLDRWLRQLFAIDQMIKGQNADDPAVALKWIIADMASLGKRLPVLEGM
jgi:DNA polymerase-3 subunit delta